MKRLKNIKPKQLKKLLKELKQRQHIKDALSTDHAHCGYWALNYPRGTPEQVNTLHAVNMAGVEAGNILDALPRNRERLIFKHGDKMAGLLAELDTVYARLFKFATLGREATGELPPNSIKHITSGVHGFGLPSMSSATRDNILKFFDYDMMTGDITRLEAPESAFSSKASYANYCRALSGSSKVSPSARALSAFGHTMSVTNLAFLLNYGDEYAFEGHVKTTPRLNDDGHRVRGRPPLTAINMRNRVLLETACFLTPDQDIKRMERGQLTTFELPNASEATHEFISKVEALREQGDCEVVRDYIGGTFWQSIEDKQGQYKGELMPLRDCFLAWALQWAQAKKDANFE